MDTSFLDGQAELAFGDPIDLWLHSLNTLKEVFIRERFRHSKVDPSNPAVDCAALSKQFGLTPDVRLSSEEMCKKITEFSIPIIAAFVLDATPNRRGAILEKMVSALAEVLGKISISCDKVFFVQDLYRSMTLFFASGTDKASEHQPEELAFLLAQFSGYVREVSHVG